MFDCIGKLGRWAWPPHQWNTFIVEDKVHGPYFTETLQSSKRVEVFPEDLLKRCQEAILDYRQSFLYTPELEDVWTVPAKKERKNLVGGITSYREGDCEDYALGCLDLLNKLGMNLRAARLIITKHPNFPDKYHMVAGIRGRERALYLDIMHGGLVTHEPLMHNQKAILCTNQGDSFVWRKCKFPWEKDS